MSAPPIDRSATKLRAMLGAGPRAVSRYTGTIFAVHLVQMFVTVACMLGVALVLSRTFANLPAFDEAVDGELTAMIEAFVFAKHSFLAIIAIVFAAIVLWQLASWFLVGGLLGVLVAKPEGRASVVRTFGASGASTYLAYARLAIIQLPALAVVLIVLSTGLNAIGPRIELALTLPDLIWALTMGVVPALVLLHYFWTVTDYARVELTMREGSVLAAYLRALLFVLKNPKTLLHGAIGWLAWIAVTLIYAYIANGRSMYGVEGAVTLFIAREGVSLLRTVIRFGVLGGQVELGRTRPGSLATAKRGEHRDVDGVGGRV